MVNPFVINEIQLYHDLWYTFQDRFLKFDSWLVKKALEKQKDLVLFGVFRGSEVLGAVRLRLHGFRRQET